jgi:hypothetical protein
VHWKTKAALFWLFERVPFGYQLHQYIQKRATRKVPKPHSTYPFYNERVERYVAAFERYGADFSNSSYLEFGAGWDLFYPFGLWCFGINDLLVIDLYALARTEYLNHTIAGLRKFPPKGAKRVPRTALSRTMHRDLTQFYGMTYMAPGDARQVRKPDRSIDLVSTTSTLEHIPFDDLETIMLELRRLCRSNAILVMLVDYSDHYSHSDLSITPYNFLRYSEEEWPRFNPAIHYQSRRRHHDYRALFMRCGFQVVEEEAKRPDDWELLMKRQPLDPEFDAMEPSMVAITAGFFVLRPAI